MAELTIQPGGSATKDTTIQSREAVWTTVNFGTGVTLDMGAKVDKAAQEVIERGLVEFDLKDLPNSVPINHARLHFNVIGFPPNVTTWEIRRLIQDFVEGTGAGDGATGTTHDGTNAWPGGDGALNDTDADIRVTFTPPTATGAFSIDIRKLVIDAYRNRSKILRMFIRDTNEVPATDTSFQVDAGDSVTAADRPKVVIGHGIAGAGYATAGYFGMVKPALVRGMI